MRRSGSPATRLFQLEAGRAALERSTPPIVLNDHDRVAAPAPRGNQLGDVLLGMGIVAGSERWILEAALNVDHEERTLSDHAADPTVGRPRRQQPVARSDDVDWCFREETILLLS